MSDIITLLTPRFATLAVLAGYFVLGGCATPATTEAMIPETASVEKTHPYSINVEVTGGRATEPTGTPQIANEAFDEAITETLEKTKAFARIHDGNSGNYELSVIIFNVQHPTAGESATVTIETGWTLTNRLTGEIVWQQALRSTYTASSGSDITPVGRLHRVQRLRHHPRRTPEEGDGRSGERQHQARRHRDHPPGSLRKEIQGQYTYFPSTQFSSHRARGGKYIYCPWIFQACSLGNQ
jgi:hypothetical protein